MDEKKLMSKIEGILFAMGDAVSWSDLRKPLKLLNLKLPMQQIS